MTDKNNGAMSEKATSTPIKKSFIVRLSRALYRESYTLARWSLFCFGLCIFFGFLYLVTDPGGFWHATLGILEVIFCIIWCIFAIPFFACEAYDLAKIFGEFLKETRNMFGRLKSINQDDDEF